MHHPQQRQQQQQQQEHRRQAGLSLGTQGRINQVIKLEWLNGSIGGKLRVAECRQNKMLHLLLERNRFEVGKVTAADFKLVPNLLDQ